MPREEGGCHIGKVDAICGGPTSHTHTSRGLRRGDPCERASAADRCGGRHTCIVLTSDLHLKCITSDLHLTYIGLTSYLHYIGLISYLHLTRLLDRCKEAAQERSAVDPRERMARRPGEPPAAAGGIRQGLPRGEGGDVLGVTRGEEVGHVDGCEHEHLPLRVARRRRLRRGRGEVVMICREIARDRARVDVPARMWAAAPPAGPPCRGRTQRHPPPPSPTPTPRRGRDATRAHC